MKVRIDGFELENFRSIMGEDKFNALAKHEREPEKAVSGEPVPGPFVGHLDPEKEKYGFIPGTKLPWEFPVRVKPGIECRNLLILWLKREIPRLDLAFKSEIAGKITGRIHKEARFRTMKPRSYIVSFLNKGNHTPYQTRVIESLSKEWNKFLRYLPRAPRDNELTRYQVEFLLWLKGRDKNLLSMWLDNCAWNPFVTREGKKMGYHQDLNFIAKPFDWSNTDEGFEFWMKQDHAWKLHLKRIGARV